MKARINELLAKLSKVKLTISTNEIVVWLSYKNAGDTSTLLEYEKKMLKVRKTNQAYALFELASSELAALNALYTATTQAGALTSYRRAVAHKFPEHPILPLLKLSKAEYSEIKDRTKISSRKKILDDRFTFSLSRLPDYRKKARNLISSNSYLDVLIGLMMVTGRRPYELLTTGAFSPICEHDSISVKHKDGSTWFDISIDETLDSTVIFTGKAKAKIFNHGQFTTDCEQDEMVIPTIISANEVISGLDKLRQFDNVQKMNDMDAYSKTVDGSLGFSHSKAVHNRISSNLNKKFKYELSTFFEQRKPYTARHLYARLNTELYDIKRELSAGFAAAILGHDNGDTETVIFYDTITIVE